MDNHIYRQMVDQAPDAILFADREGIIRLWNKGAELVFGFSAEEALGQSLDLIIPENLRQRHWDGYHRVMAGGETKYGTGLLSVPALHKSGERRFTDFTIIMIRDEAGQLLGIASVMRDTTAQKAKEKEMRERIRELEGNS